MDVFYKLRRYFQSFLFVILCFASPAFATSSYNMPYGVTPMSHDIYRLHMLTFEICCLIGVLVFGAMIYIMIKFRRSKGAKPGGVDEHFGIEVIWTVIPFLILVGLAIPSTMVLQRIHDYRQPQLNIKITGYQWKWQYQYLDQGISFFSDLSTPQDQIYGNAPKDKWFLLEVDHPLVLPIHEKIRLLVTSNDVIHDWWVPALGVKQDAVPGYINENWTFINKPGIYRGQCGELCGINHAFMPIVVKAVTQKDFAKWVAKETHQKELAVNASKKPLKKYTKKELMKMGKATYDKTCSVCHQMTGKGLPPTFPAIKGGDISTGPVAAHINIVLNGKQGTAMQAFKDQLDDTNIAAVITYERNAWGNDAIVKKKKLPALVQPEQVKKIRDK